MQYKDNPFRVLGVSPIDGRREIVRKAEEKELLLDQQDCANARTMLTTPQRRIAAEVHWFLDCDDSEIKEIEDYIAGQLEGKNGDNLQWEDYCPLTQLNIQLACIDAQDFQNAPSAKFYILGISRLFESVDADSVLQLINVCRNKAGFPEVINTQEVESALAELRTEIKQSLSHHLQRIPEDCYIQIVTILSESYSGNQRYKGQAVLEDVISEYQIYIDDTLHQFGQSIIKTAKFILMGAKKIDVSRAVSDLLDQLRAWDRLAQPLQLGALTKGSSHEESREMLLSLRELAVNLHNEYNLSEESLAITIATQEVFKELPEYAELLNEDNQALTGIIEEKEKEDTLDPEMLREQETIQRIQEGFEQLESCIQEANNSPRIYREGKISALLAEMVELDQLVKVSVGDQALCIQIRERIAYMVRSVGIELHNTRSDTEYSLKVITAVKKEFGDLSKISNETNRDISILEQEINRQKAITEAKAKSERRKKRKGTIIACVAFAVLLGWIVAGIVNSRKPDSNQTTLATSATPRPTVKPSSTMSPTAKPTTKPTTTPRPTVKPTATPKPTAKPTPTPQPKEMPQNGKVFFCSTSDRPSSFKVTNNSSSNYYMKFVKAGTNTKVITFFVRANSTATIDMPSGNLELKYAYGNTWYGETLLFGDKTQYARDKEYYDFTNYTWEISFKATTSTGDTMMVEDIDADDF